MRRVAAKGEGPPQTLRTLARISWNEALGRNRFRVFKDISDEHGPESDPSVFLRGLHSGVLNGGSMDRRFFHRIGAFATRACHLFSSRGKLD